MKLALFAAAAILAPLLLLRRRALARYFAIAVAVWAVFGILSIVVRRSGIDVDGYLAFVTCGVITIAILWLIVASAAADDVRWSASRAAIAAALIYLAAVPLMMRTPPDGDESYYILMTESLAHDGDLDLSNQFRNLAHSATERTNLEPQLGDFAGKHGETYSHLEPFLSMLLVPGYLAGKLPGVLVTMAIFGALLARSMIRFFEEEGIADTTIRAVFPLVAFGPPVVFYAIRVWPEVPATLAFVEAIRGVRARRTKRWVPALLALVLLKLRFVLIAVLLMARAVRRPKQLAIAVIILLLPLSIAWLISGNATSVHTVRELIPGNAAAMLRGLFGLALDGQQGIAFQAPLYLFGLIALFRWRSMPAGFRIGFFAAALYIFYLIPRAEWHGGWSPPLRYVVFLMPVLALGCAALWERINLGAIVVVTAWTLGLVVHGMTYPWRLFHIENGENFIGETLSTIWHSDFSRLFPSYIRLNYAAYVAAAVLVVAIALFRTGRTAWPIAIAALAVGFVFGLRPGNRIEFEDAHVIHRGGALYPYVWQVQRFLYRGGWIVGAGDSMSFLARGGTSVLQYQADAAATVQLGTRTYALPATGAAYGAAPVEIDHSGRVELRCLAGSVNLDRMDHE